VNARFRLFKPEAPNSYKFIIGNPVILEQIMAYNMEPALTAPWNFLLVERRDQGTEIMFDLPSTTMGTELGIEGLDEQAAKLEGEFKKLVESWM
jgi:uncharacterized protein (DUF302 family)